MKETVRQSFLQFFKSKDHALVPSDSLVPSSDPTLLFTSAGMVQFKAHFLQQIPLTFHRAASSQRCLRTTDIEQVGLTARHLTFFEMLGNFSFGDYFKEDAIAWAWEFLTKTLALSPERLWISVYKDDGEAQKLWKKHVPESRIVRMGEESNFWTMGPTGPCGPCSEIYWDRGDTPSATGPDDSDRWMEVWNLVFTQYDRQADGTLLPLPKKNIDTGMGLERLASVVEGVAGNWDTSLLKPLLRFGEDTFRYTYGTDPRKDVALRIVADHLRAVTFLFFDGILPSNEGRGYVLRRLLRRATRQGTLFGTKEPFLHAGVKLVSDLMKETAPDLETRKSSIETLVRQEEERFHETLETGLQKYHELVESPDVRKKKVLSGEQAFLLYGTYGFPVEVTKEMLAERGMKLDEAGFKDAAAKARDMAREGWKGSGQRDVALYNEIKKRVGATAFRGYETLTVRTAIKALVKDGQETPVLRAGESGEVIAAESPFYPEGGGQVGDVGWLKNGDTILAKVTDAQKPTPDLTAHVLLAKADLKAGDIVDFTVDRDHREPTKRHHTATHLLHAALRKVLGTTVTQAGSLVAPDRLRFDYTHSRPLTPGQITEIENIVNNVVLENLDVTPRVVPAAEAKKMGAMALFGEKYGDQVRCLIVSSKGFEDPGSAFSLELCGGTHVSASGDIGAFKILSDSSLASGVRRIEAVAGMRAIEYFRGIEQSLTGVAEKLKAAPQDVEGRVAKLIERQRQLEQEIRDLKLKQAQGNGASAAAGPNVRQVDGINLAVNVTEGLAVGELRTLADRLKQQVKSGVVFVATSVKEKDRDKVSFVVAVTADLQEKGVNAGKIAKAVSAEIGGSGGGRPDFAQGGGQDKDRLAAAVEKLPAFLK